MSDKTQSTLVFGAIGLILVWFAFLAPHTNTWNGDGEIDVFPDYANSVKNYRLPATIDASQKTRGFFSKDDKKFRVRSADWPDGGTLDFDSCNVGDGNRADCTNTNGDTYTIEVVTVPDPPASD